MDRKRSQGPAADEEALRQVGDVLRTTFCESDLAGGDEDMTRLLLHLSHEPKEKGRQKAPKPEPAAARPAKRKSWLRRKRPSRDGF